MKNIIIAIIPIAVGVSIGMYMYIKPTKVTNNVQTETKIQTVQKPKPDAEVNPINSDLTGLEWNTRVLKVIFEKRPDVYEDILTQFNNDPRWFEKCKSIVAKTGTMGPYSGMVIKRVITENIDSEQKAEMLNAVVPNSRESLIAQQIMAEDLIANYKICTLWWKCLNSIKVNPSSNEVDILLGYWKKLEPFAKGGYNSLTVERNKLLPKASQLEVNTERWSCTIEDVNQERNLPKEDTKQSAELAVNGSGVEHLRLKWDRSIRYYKTQAKTKLVPLPLVSMSQEQLEQIRKQL